MRIAILHFHLRPGGVTRVIELATRALAEQDVEPLVISGEARPESSRLDPGQVQFVPELAYGGSPAQAEALIAGVEEACRRRWGAPADLLHIHNHALGKSFCLPLAVARWAREGRPLLLQMHDFAENGRPANYQALLKNLGGTTGLSSLLYPSADHVELALLNSSDARSLELSGLRNRPFLLSNPVSLAEADNSPLRDQLGAGRVVVYPTRGIRRKNIGEAVFWAAQAEEGEIFLISSAPEDAAGARLYAEWKTFAAELQLPIRFDAARELGRNVCSLVRGSDACLTTSVEEGFGMAFLEPWLAEKAIIGRNLPGVTCDFVEQGIALDHLYERLDVPLDLFAAGAVEMAIRHSANRTLEAYGYGAEEDLLSRARKSVIRENSCDFGRLPEELQKQAIREILRRKISVPHPSSPDVKSITENAERVRTHYSLSAYGKKLSHVYERVLGEKAGPVDFLQAREVLKNFLRLDDFSALRAL